MRHVPFTHQLQTTDEQFLDHLNLPARAGRQLARALNSSDFPEVRRIVANYFRTRKSPAWSYWSHGSPWHQTDAPGPVLEKADNLLTHRFRNSWAPHQWMDLSTSSPDPDWMKGIEQARTSLSRGTWVTELSTAFAITGDPKYAAKAMHLIRSFVNAVPFTLDPRFEEDHDTYFGGPADTTQFTSYRLFRLTDFLFSGAFHARGVCSDDDLFWLVKQIWFLSSQYYRLLDDELRRDNHHLLDHGHLPFAMALAFPEFKWSPELLRAGVKVIRHHFGHNLLPDGAYAEHSTNYQYHVLFHFTHPHGLAKANNYKLFTKSQINSLRKWVEFSARAGKPDGRLPSIGDEPGRPLHHLFGTLATPLIDKHLSSIARALACTPGTHKFATPSQIGRSLKNWQLRTPLPFGVSEYYTTPSTSRRRRAADAPATVAPPRILPSRNLPTPPTSQYPRGGYTFFRSSWTPDADYLAVSHFSGDYGGHAHWDPMSFILHTQGKTLIGDPASWLYVSPRFHGHGGDHRKSVAQQPLPYRGYSYSVNAHNCLVINDDTLKPLEAMNHGTFWGGWPPKHTLGLFEAGGPIEVAEIFNSANHPTTHRRFFVHIKGIGFALIDLLSKRPNLSPHEYSQYFHFEPDVALSPESPASGQSLRASLDSASCLILPGAETESRWRTFRDPYLDDVYGVPHTKGPPWVASLTRRIRGQAVFSHFFLTSRVAQLAHPFCRYLGTNPSPWLDWQHDSISAHSLDLGPAGTLLLASAPYGTPVSSPELSTDAELAVVHLDRRNRIKAWAMAYGRTLNAFTDSLVRGRTRDWLSS